MDREIKFRAWEPDARELIYFDNIKASKDPYIASHLCSLMAGEHPKGKGLLMQYTGLKDKNGVEIFEGDIVKAAGEYAAVVKFSQGSFCIRHETPRVGCTVSLQDVATDRYEVIGNIHENPELLEVKS